jgi:hypothetical protein
MSMAQLFVNPASDCLEVEKYTAQLVPVQAGNLQQKNWTPFTHSGLTYLIQYINPLTVVQPVEKKVQFEGAAVYRTYGHVVSQVGEAKLHWPYGSIHGGTNALLLSCGTRYLSFFHSVIRRPQATPTSSTSSSSSSSSSDAPKLPRLYFVGAFTFTSTPPFKLLQVSRMPIMNTKLWVGPKAKKKNIETVVFPTHFFFNKSDCVVSAGYQDQYGVILRINTGKLLSSLVDIEPY